MMNMKLKDLYRMLMHKPTLDTTKVHPLTMEMSMTKIRTPT